MSFFHSPATRLGLLLAYAGVQAIQWAAPQGLPRLDAITIGPLLLLFALALSVIAGLLFGLIPVLRFGTPNVAGALKEGGRLSSAGRERHRARNTLVVGQVRMALGAAQRDVSALFLRYGLILTACGVTIGLIAAAGVTRALSAMLYGVTAIDPATYGVVAIGLAATTLLASYIPAARAARIEPAVALRREG